MAKRAFLVLALAGAALLTASCDPIEGPGNPATGTGDAQGPVNGGSAGSGSSSSGKNCSDFSSQSDAQADFNSGNSGLDGDNDGVACEDLLK